MPKFKEKAMPRKPKRPCSFPGCPKLTEGRFCEEHEKEENTVSYRLHGEQKTTTVSLDEFVEKVKTQIATKALEIN